MEQEQKEAKKPKAWIEYGGPGHEREYVFSIEQLHGRDDQMPYEIVQTIESELGEAWDVANRGTRIEITCKKPYGARDDLKINTVFRKALGDDYDFLPAN